MIHIIICIGLVGLPQLASCRCWLAAARVSIYIDGDDDDDDDDQYDDDDDEFINIMHIQQKKECQS
ncbi:MAG: hypothetical protein ACKPKO_26920 [Candidatus Fonsibacter sp.]